MPFPACSVLTHGVPQDRAGAKDLADRGKYHEFEKWALSLIDAQPDNLGKKGADRGLDGRLYYGKTGHGIVSVKAGENVGVSMIGDLKGVIERAPVPRLQIVTVEQAMQLRERVVHLPARREDTFKRAAREEDTGRQSALDL